MDSDAKSGRTSTLLADERFAAQDERFVESVRAIAAPKYLAGLAERWKKDPRPWARRQIFSYLALPLDRPGHHPLVKRLFKHAEHQRDTELMAAFMVAFDRLVRRQRRMRYHWDHQTRRSWQEEELFAPRNQITPDKPRDARNPRTGERISVSGGRAPRHGRLFSYRTRRYLQRRAWRYLRRLGFQRPAEYPAAIAAALALYQDDDLARGENILDSWSLVHAAFRRSPVLVFKRSTIEVAEGGSLGGLVAAPQFEALWRKPESTDILLKLVMQAPSRLVRVWAIQLLKQGHAAALQAISVDQLLALLDHANEEVQNFGASLLGDVAGAASWPISTWLRLLETRNVAALATICDAMSRHVSPARLSLEQCVALASTRTTPVARLGLNWLAGRAVTTAADRAAVARLAHAECEAIGAEAAAYALAIIGEAATYRLDEVVAFFDSRNAEVRRGAWAWLTPQSAGYADAGLWSRLLETPYEDVRLRLVDALSERTRESRESRGPVALRRQDISTVWTTVLLGVHRGGRAKLTALRQISDAIAAQPERAEQLLPVLAVAIRSVRVPEARAGLAAILSAVAARPELEAALARSIPELRLKLAEAMP